MSTSATQRRLKGKVAIITGGAHGIGEASARLFNKHGAKVIIADIADDAGHKLAESLSQWAVYIHCDVSKEEDVRAAVDLAMEKHGQLDIMFNNAGMVDSHRSSVVEYNMEQFERTMNVNVKGVMHGIKHAARVMIPRRKGCIISTASISGVVGGTTSYGYTASKHAVIGLTKNGAAELGKYGIRVNCVSPYLVATGLIMNYSAKGKNEMETWGSSLANLKGTILKAEDIAEAALYLASDESKYVSGHNLVVDGGFTVVNHDWGLYRP
ncbi:short-chain dehydrogenase reductase 2a-like [Cryptomeria japonica]|uniref:short-chain dehydrogenase reductase 2a-like n=1 Tax=Cryptomeria japonica TaxID=3369 RepID=UPI0025AC3CDB|nr:short-chain dehydrogenase reductase 2a-like [Cryptomeria japonica]